MPKRTYASALGSYANRGARYVANQAVKQAMNYAHQQYKRYRYGGRKYRRQKPSQTRTIKQQRMVQRLQKKVDQLCLSTIMATHTRRQRRVNALTTVANDVVERAEYNDGGTLGEMENAMTQLRFFDPVTNSMVVADPAQGTYQRELCMSVYRKITLRNNYHVPCHIEVWTCEPKAATNVSPLTAFAAGLADQNNPPANSQLVHMTDSIDLTELWKLTSTKRYLLPGEEFTATSMTPEFKYQFGTADLETDAYQKAFGGHSWVVCVHGVPGHDISVLGQVHTLKAGVDIMRTTTYVIKYDAGKDVHDISIDDSVGNFTNQGRVSQIPAAFQQSYGH